MINGQRLISNVLRLFFKPRLYNYAVNYQLYFIKAFFQHKTTAFPIQNSLKVSTSSLDISTAVTTHSLRRDPWIVSNQPQVGGQMFFSRTLRQKASLDFLCIIVIVISEQFKYRKTSDRSPRLLSVQVSQTPGLYAGPGVYTGPGLYHNMSSLCYFIQKKIVNFHVYRVPVFCLF